MARKQGKKGKKKRTKGRRVVVVRRKRRAPRKKAGTGVFGSHFPTNRVIDSNQYWQLRAEIAGAESRASRSLKDRQAEYDRKEANIEKVKEEVRQFVTPEGQARIRALNRVDAGPAAPANPTPPVVVNNNYHGRDVAYDGPEISSESRGAVAVDPETPAEEREARQDRRAEFLGAHETPRPEAPPPSPEDTRAAREKDELAQAHALGQAQTVNRARRAFGVFREAAHRTRLRKAAQENPSLGAAEDRESHVEPTTSTAAAAAEVARHSFDRRKQRLATAEGVLEQTPGRSPRRRRETATLQQRDSPSSRVLLEAQRQQRQTETDET
eukprot:COSAG04_NODE_370_length_15729_cov_5.743506_11_plen_326_part_00